MLRVLPLCLLLVPSPVAADVFLFRTPSGNIQCSVGLEAGGADVQCDIIEKSGPDAAPRPAGCTAVWGHSFVLTHRGPATMVCGEAPRAFGDVEVAPYGESGEFEQIRCLSERTGLECRNADGHGFFLSRRKQSLF